LREIAVKIERLRELTREELLQKSRDVRQELFNLRLRRSLQPPDNPLLLRTLKRQLARIKTVLHEDESGIRALGTGKKILE
jgi:large subunit ribosomal protein L29